MQLFVDKLTLMPKKWNGCKSDYMIWIFHNFVRTHYTNTEVPGVALGVTDKGMSFENVLRLRMVDC